MLDNLVSCLLFNADFVLLDGGLYVFFSESTVLPELPDVLIAVSTVQEWGLNEDDDDEPDIIVNHSAWSRPFLADHAKSAWLEQTQRDAARARHIRKYVRGILSL
jgi:hypothetical protein